MTNARFRQIQDDVLKLSGKDFAALLQVDPASISKWRTENREIPSYIASLVQFRALEAEGNLQIPISLTDLIGLSRAAERRGITVEALLLQLIRGIIDVPVLAPKQKDYKPEVLDGPPPARASLKAAEEPSSPPIPTKRKSVSYKPTLNKPATED